LKPKKYSAGYIGNNELDTHADTFCAGKNFTPISFTGTLVDVSPYSSQYQPMKDIPIATVGTLWTHPQTKQDYILVVHEAIYFGDLLDHSLVNPNQLRHFGIQVSDNPYDHEHPLQISTDVCDIPLDINGTIISFQTRAPTDEELNSYPHIVLTSDHPWDPHNVVLGAVSRSVEEEAANVSEALRIAHFPETNYILNDPDCDVYFNHGKLCKRLASAVKVRSTGRSNVSANTIR
jgi:hypothetical protein